MFNREELIAKIRRSLFLKPELKQKLYALVPNLPEGAIKKLANLLLKSARKEWSFIKGLIQRDKEFPQKLAIFMINEIKQTRKEMEHKEESSEQTQEEKLMSQIQKL